MNAIINALSAQANELMKSQTVIDMLAVAERVYNEIMG